MRGQRALQLCPNVSFQGIRFGARHIEQVDARFRMATGDGDKQFDANAAAFRCGHTHDIETWVDARSHFSTNRRHPSEVDKHVQSLATSGRGINRVARELEECIRESTRLGDVSGARLDEPGSADGRLRYSANARLGDGKARRDCLG